MTVNVTMTMTYEEIRDFLFAEARYLDDKQWDEWLECYSKDAEFWIPSWDDDGRLVEDPHSEISLMYYAHRDGLEDRVFRIRTEKSTASTPEPRTSHNLSNIEVLESDASGASVRFNWVTCSHRYKADTFYYGTSFYRLVRENGAIKIAKKKCVLKNDYIHHVIDIYQV
jgi:benzoate/toluate 1,2-dioxygenase beta subunit